MEIKDLDVRVRKKSLKRIKPKKVFQSSITLSDAQQRAILRKMPKGLETFESMAKNMQERLEI